MATFIDASTHSVAELIQFARDAVKDRTFVVVVSGEDVATRDLIEVTTAGGGYVSFQLEPRSAPKMRG